MRSRFVLTSLFVASATLGQVHEHVSVNLVEVPVSVVDAKGNAIRGLTAKNFALAEDGQSRNVTVFDTVDYGVEKQAANTPSPRVEEAVARRTFLLLFDLSYTNPKSFLRAQTSAREFVAKALAPDDLVGVATIDADRGVLMISGFTTDRSLTEAAVDDPSQLASHDPLQIAGRYAYQEIELGPKRVGADPNLLGGWMKLYLDTTHENDQFERRRVELELGHLGQLAMKLRSLPGRKQVVLLSEGFSAQTVQGRDIRDSSEAATELEQVIRGAVFRTDNDVRLGSSTAMVALGQMARSFHDADVVLHAVDIQGLRLENDVTVGARLNSNEGLGILTRATGGMLFEHSNDLSGDLSRLLHAQEVVYVLGFQTASNAPGRFHTLTVRVTGVPSSSKVYCRTGYYENSVETAEERALTNADIILNDLPQDGVHVAALATAFPSADGLAQVPVVLELSGSDIVRDTLESNSGIEIFIYAFGADGAVHDSIYNTIQLDLSKVGQLLQSNGLKFCASLALPPGKYAIRSLVRVAKVNQRGYVRTDVVVAAPGEVFVQPPVFLERPAQSQWVLVRGSRHGGGDDPFAFDGQAFVPGVTGVDRFVVMVENAPPEDLELDVPDGILHLSSWRAGGNAALVMKIDRINPKAQTADVTVRQKGLDASPQRPSIRFPQPKRYQPRM